MRSCPMLKCSMERWVCAPHSLSEVTSTTPRLSVSFLMSGIGLSRVASDGKTCGAPRVGQRPSRPAVLVVADDLYHCCHLHRRTIGRCAHVHAVRLPAPSLRLHPRRRGRNRVYADPSGAD